MDELKQVTEQRDKLLQLLAHTMKSVDEGKLNPGVGFKLPDFSIWRSVCREVLRRAEAGEHYQIRPATSSDQHAPGLSQEYS